MVELIATIILFGGLIGMGVIIFRKIPALVQLPETSPMPGFNTRIRKIFEKIRITKHFKLPSFETFLQKILSKIKILTLKIEAKTENWLRKLREKTQKKKENDKYWQELKKSIDEEKPEDKKNK
jgi:hypothetical protein